MKTQKPTTEVYIFCDLCGALLKRENTRAISIAHSNGELEHRNVCLNCLRRAREAPTKYVKKEYVKHGVWPGCWMSLIEQISAIKSLLLRPQKLPLKRDQSIEEIRDQSIERILDAMIEVEILAENAPAETERGKADTTRARYYQLLGYLTQVLDGVLKSVESQELENRLRAVEAMLNELEKGEAQKGGGEAS